MVILDRAEVEAALSGFALGPRLGRGGGGVVFAARQVALSRDVAVKVLAGDGMARDRLRTEARILASLDHPHVVAVYDLAEGASLSVIVMELMRGGSLTSRLGRADHPTLCAVALAITEGLHFAHTNGVLHRDVKPANILFTSDGTPKIGDFGIARVFEGSGITPSQVIGTPTYMAPEQFGTGRLTTATDLYALGAVVYQMLAGHPPFDPTLGHGSLMRHHLEIQPPPLHGVPSALAAPVLRALSKDPADRHPSVRAFAVELAAAATEVFGPGWLAHTGLHLCLADDVESAAGAHPKPDPEPDPASAGPSAPGRVPDLAADDPLPPSEPRPPHRNKRQRSAGARLAALLAVVAVAIVAAVLLFYVARFPFGQDPAVADSAQRIGLPTPTAVYEGTFLPLPGTGGTPTSAASTPTPVAPTPTPPPPPTPEPVFAPVVILNKSTIQGQAQAAIERVEAAGFPVDRVGNFVNKYNVPVSTVFYDPEYEAAARTMQDRIPGVERIIPKSATEIRSAEPLILVVTRDFPTDLTEG